MKWHKINKHYTVHWRQAIYSLECISRHLPPPIHTSTSVSPSNVRSEDCGSCHHVSCGFPQRADSARWDASPEILPNNRPACCFLFMTEESVLNISAQQKKKTLSLVHTHTHTAHKHKDSNSCSYINAELRAHSRSRVNCVIGWESDCKVDVEELRGKILHLSRCGWRLSMSFKAL